MILYPVLLDNMVRLRWSRSVCFARPCSFKYQVSIRIDTPRLHDLSLALPPSLLYSNFELHPVATSTCIPIAHCALCLLSTTNALRSRPKSDHLFILYAIHATRGLQHHVALSPCHSIHLEFFQVLFYFCATRFCSAPTALGSVLDTPHTYTHTHTTYLFCPSSVSHSTDGSFACSTTCEHSTTVGSTLYDVCLLLAYHHVSMYHRPVYSVLLLLLLRTTTILPLQFCTK